MTLQRLEEARRRRIQSVKRWASIVLNFTGTWLLWSRPQTLWSVPGFVFVLMGMALAWPDLKDDWQKLKTRFGVNRDQYGEQSK